MAINLMRKYGKPLMAFFSAILMVTFLIGYTFSGSSGLGSSGPNYPLGTLRGHTLNSSDLIGAQIDLAVLQELSAVNFIYGIPISHWLSGHSDSTDSALQFYLLLDEAKQAGIAPDNQYVSQEMSDPDVMDQITNLISDPSGKYVQANVEQALSDLSIIRRYFFSAFSSGVTFSAPQLQQYITQLKTKVQINYVLLSAAGAFNQGLEQPPASSDQLNTLFNDYKDVLPWDPSSDTPPPLIDGHRYPFGYRYPDQVKIEFIKFDRAAARALFKPTLQDVQAAYAYYLAHPDKFSMAPPATGPAASTQPVLQSFDQVRTQLILAQIDGHVTGLFNNMTDFALHQTATPWQQQDVNGYHVNIPQSQWVSYDALAASLGSRFGYTPKVGRSDQWMDAADLASLNGISDALPENDADLPGKPTFGDLALQVKELVPNPTDSTGLGLLFHLQVGTEGPILTDPATGDEYIYRITAASPSHVPATLVEAQSTVENDAIMLRFYQADIAKAQQIVASAQQSSLAAAANAENLQLQTPGPFTALESLLTTNDGSEQHSIVPGKIPGLPVSNDDLMNAAFDLARRAADQAAATTRPGAISGKPATAIALDPQLQVVVMQLVQAQPMPSNQLVQMMQMISVEYGIDEPQWQMAQVDLVNNWLSLDSVTGREGFVAITNK
jgi:hypothetical protein